MKLIQYKYTNEFLKDIYPYVIKNIISHLVLFETIERIVNGSEKIEIAFTVKKDEAIEIIYLHTGVMHYFLGNPTREASILLLEERLSKDHFSEKSILYGNATLIDKILRKIGLSYVNHRHRYHMTCTKNPNNNGIQNENLNTAEVKDFNFLAPLKLKFYDEEFEGKGFQTKEMVLNEFKNDLQSEGTFYWLHEGQISTLIDISILPEEKILISNIYTLPEFRKRGISKIALATLMTQLFHDGNIEIGLNVKTSNKSAINLFNSLGFERIYDTGYYLAPWNIKSS